MDLPTIQHLIGGGLAIIVPAFIILVIILPQAVRILREYERGVIFRLGRVLPQPKGPGIILVFAPIDRIVRVSLRVDTLEEVLNLPDMLLNDEAKGDKHHA